MTQLTSTNPATGDVIWQQETTSVAQVREAIIAARKAFPSWARKSVEERIKIAEDYRDILTQRKGEIAEAIAKETGKALWDATGEAGAMIGKIAISIKAYHERTGSRQFDMGAGMNGHLSHKPHGVLAVFGPYNFPAHLPNGHIVPALLAGNVVVFKPSEMTPMVGELMVKCWRDAGLPHDVLQIVQGMRDVGEALAGDATIDGLLFTGSSEVGGILNKLYASQPHKILALEMGGNNPLIVWNPSDVKAAAYHTIQSAFISTGQRCTCARRLILPEGKQGDELLEHLVTMAKAIQIGAYDDESQPFMGPLIRHKEAQMIIDAQTAWQEQGGVSLLEATMPREGLPFITTGIMDVTAIKDREDKELFGPFLQVIRVASFDEAIAEANNTRYGLSSAIFTQDKALYDQARFELRAGLVNWNRQTTGASGAMPFGGTGVSGNHRPAGYYAADYCAYPVASVESTELEMPEVLAVGIKL